MNDYALVYWDKNTKKPITHYLNENVTNILDFANYVVPQGTTFNVVHTNDLAHKTIPKKIELALTDGESKSLFFEYFKAL